MRLGKLNSKVVIKRLADGQDDIGQPTQNPVTVATVMADIRFLNGLESIKGGAQASVTAGSVRIRRRTDVLASMWLETDELPGWKLQITAVKPDLESRQRLDLTVEVIS